MCTDSEKNLKQNGSVTNFKKELNRIVNLKLNFNNAQNRNSVVEIKKPLIPPNEEVKSNSLPQEEEEEGKG